MIAVVGGSTLWFLSRATGIVAFVLLTLTVVLGIATSLRLQTRNLPRFVIEYLHRNVTVLVMALIAIHVTSVVLDGFAPIGWAAAVIPFSSPYRPIWLSLGALGFDLLLAVAVTSWLRHRVGFRVWRFLHWSAYASWLVVLVHAFGTGSDTPRRLGTADRGRLRRRGGRPAVVADRRPMGRSRRRAGRGAHRDRRRTARCWPDGFSSARWRRTGLSRAGTPASVLARSSASSSTTTSSR